MVFKYPILNILHIINEIKDVIKTYCARYLEIPRAVVGNTIAQIGSILPRLGVPHSKIRTKPSRNTSSRAGLSLAMSLCTVSTKLAE